MSFVLIGGTGRSGSNIIREILALSSDVASPFFETRYAVDAFGVLHLLRSAQTERSPFIIDEMIWNHSNFLKKLANKNHLLSMFNKFIKVLPGNKKELLITGFPYAEWDLESHFPGYRKRLNKYLEVFDRDSYSATRPGYSPMQLKPKLNYFRSSSLDRLKVAAMKFMSGNMLAAMVRGKASVYVDDNTHNLLYASTYSNLIPHMKFIHVRRHPFDVVASYINQRWCPSTAELAAVIVSDLLYKIEEELSHVSKENVLTVSLEKLVEDSGSQIDRLCEFIGVDVLQKMKNVDLTNNNIGRYKKQFSESELLCISEILEPHLKSFNNLRAQDF